MSMSFGTTQFRNAHCQSFSLTGAPLDKRRQLAMNKTLRGAFGSRREKHRERFLSSRGTLVFDTLNGVESRVVPYSNVVNRLEPEDDGSRSADRSSFFSTGAGSIVHFFKICCN